MTLRQRCDCGGRLTDGEVLGRQRFRMCAVCALEYVSDARTPVRYEALDLHVIEDQNRPGVTYRRPMPPLPNGGRRASWQRR